jgi:uncharacterized protein
VSTLQIQEEFEVDAEPDRVFAYLIDPEEISVCLPGATLDEIKDERTFLGHMTVKVGPVTVGYHGTIEFLELDRAERRVKMQGTGREKGGAGTARMLMESRVEPREGGGARVTVHSDVQLAGRIVRFGRGMIQSVSAQLFKEFAARVRENVARQPEPGDFEAAGEVPPAEAAAEAAAVDGAEAVGEAAASEAAAVVRGEEDAAAERTAAAPAGPMTARPGGAVAKREAEPLRLLPVLVRALWDWVSKPFRRLFGRKR